MKRLDYYYPTLGGSWILVALLLGGSLAFGVLLAILQRIVPSPVWTATSLSYLMSMILPFIFIFYVGGIRRKEGFLAVPVNHRCVDVSAVSGEDDVSVAPAVEGTRAVDGGSVDGQPCTDVFADLPCFRVNVAASPLGDV